MQQVTEAVLVACEAEGFTPQGLRDYARDVLADQGRTDLDRERVGQRLFGDSEVGLEDVAAWDGNATEEEENHWTKTVRIDLKTLTWEQVDG
jgi:hypothetical protein